MPNLLNISAVFAGITAIKREKLLMAAKIESILYVN